MNLKKTIFLLAAAVLITGSAFAQVKKKPAASAAHKTTPTPARQQAKPAVITALPVDPDVIIGKLPNGLTYYIRKNSVPKGRANLFLVNKVGSVAETDAQQGLANFIQHMAFKGTRDFPKDGLAAYLKKLGGRYGPDTSSFTNYDATIYQLLLPTDTAKLFADGFKLMANWAAYITFNPAEINSEKAKVAKEAALGGKTPQERLQEQTLPVLLNNSRYAMRSPSGRENTISAFNEATVKSFYTDWYRPDLQAIIAVGDFDPKQVQDLIKSNFSSLRNPAPEKPQPQFSVPAAPGTTVKIATDKSFPYTVAQIVVRHPQAIVKTAADFMQNMRVALFNQMLNTRITELTQTQNPVVLFGQADYGSFAGKQDAFTSLVVANPGGLESAVKAMVAELLRARKFGFTQTELERAKQNSLAQITNSYNAKDNTQSGNFPAEYERNFLTGQAIPGIDYEYNYYINNIGKINLAEMTTLAAKLISDENRVILIEANDTEKDKLPNEQTVLKWVAEADKDLTAYVDDSANPLMTAKPAPGKATDVKTDSTLLVTNITLANGIKVILKPTKFRNNQILFSGYSFGGTSLANDQDYTSATLASTVIGNSGIGNYTQVQLNKMMRGKSLSVSPYIVETTQGITGYAAPEDFETAMQLLYLYFTNPRKDAGVWKNYIDQLKSGLAHKQNDPGSVYQDTVSAVLSNYNQRGMPVTEAKLDAASLDKAYSFYKDRFADAGSFTFTFTGAFLTPAITSYLETYLGSLPSTNSKQTYKNLDIHPPGGQITKTVYKGVSDKATAQLIYSGSYEYNEANNVQMDALEDVLNIRLSDSLKKESGIYSAGVRASYVKIPAGRYRITVSFVCDANNVDRSIAYMQEEISKIKQNGPIPKDVQLFINRDARTMQQQLKQNEYWQATLSVAVQNQQDPDRILNHMQDLEQVTPQSVKETANKYLNNNLIKLILLPEKK